MNQKIKKGIILAGGKGTRLLPMTKTVGKPLLPVYDKPLIYYPLSTLISIGVKEVLLISTKRDLDGFKALLGDGSQFGISIEYDIQSIAKGIPDAFVIGEQFIGNDNVVLVLGDNVFHPIDTIAEAVKTYNSGSMIFGFPVTNPEAFGVAEIDSSGNVKAMEEKPEHPKSNLAIIGLYLFDNQVTKYAKELSPSKRGELEILHVIQHYLDTDNLKFQDLGHDFNWFDAGNPDSLLEVSNFAFQQKKIAFGSVEIAALENNDITLSEFNKLLSAMPNCMYKSRLELYVKGLNQ